MVETGFRVGDQRSLEKTITAELVQTFAALSGDFNPVHMDEDYCRQHHMEKRVAHGMLVLSFLSTLIGMYLPGPGALWMSQSMEFLSPVRIDDTITIEGTVVDVNETNALKIKILTIKIKIKNQTGALVAKGTVKVTIK